MWKILTPVVLGEHKLERRLTFCSMSGSCQPEFVFLFRNKSLATLILFKCFILSWLYAIFNTFFLSFYLKELRTEHSFYKCMTLRYLYPTFCAATKQVEWHIWSNIIFNRIGLNYSKILHWNLCTKNSRLYNDTIVSEMCKVWQYIWWCQKNVKKWKLK